MRILYAIKVSVTSDFAAGEKKTSLRTKVHRLVGELDYCLLSTENFLMAEAPTRLVASPS